MTRTHLRHLAALLVLTMTALATVARAAGATDITVERVRPEHEKHMTLRFLKENRDFIRGSIDRLRETKVARSGDSGPIDPRFLAYRDMLAAILASSDSATVLDRERAQLELLRSITQLGDLERELDLLDRQIADQRARLSVLQRDFTGRQQTALAVVLSGYPVDAALSQLSLTLEDGSPLTIALSPEQRAALQHGGIIQVFHGFVEPREQFVAIGIGGDRWPSLDTGYVTLDPERDHLTMLRLDLSTVHAELGAPSIHASAWLNDALTP